jgi:hypothetical protein
LSDDRLRTLPRWLVAAAFSALTPTFGGAQDCPTAQSGKDGFVVERGEQQKSEVFHGEGGIVRTAMRVHGTTVLETTQHQGLFQLDRIDNGKRTKFEPKSDLNSLFPLKPGHTVKATFAWEGNGQQGPSTVELAVKGTDVVYIGPCKYSVLKIDRSESRTAAPPRFIDTEYYSPELRMILAREFHESGGGTNIVKYDRIHPLKR